MAIGIAPSLGVAHQFGALGNSGVTGSTGAGTTVTGDVGSSPNPAISNFPPSSVLPPFTKHTTNDATVQQAHTDAIAAYNFLAAQGPGSVIAAQLDGAVLTSGIYSFQGGAADLAALGTLTLNGTGVFIFQVDSALTMNVGSNVVGTADPCNIYWRIGTSATLNGVNTRGIFIADASITLGSGSNVQGILLAGTGPTGAVTMAGSGGNTIGGCSVPSGCPVITVSPSTLPNGVLGDGYSQSVSGSGGTAPYTFAVTAGVLPTGLTLNPFTGAITGTLSALGLFSFEITVTDANECPGTQTYNVVVSTRGCPTITLSPSTLPNGVVGTPYSQTITASGGTAPYTFNVTSGALPTSLTLNTSTGAITGTPTLTDIGTFNFTVTALDSNGCPGSMAYTLIIISVPPRPRKRRTSGGFAFAPSICVPRCCYTDETHTNIAYCNDYNKQFGFANCNNTNDKKFDLVPCPEVWYPYKNGVAYVKYSEDDKQCCYRLRDNNNNNRRF